VNEFVLIKFSNRVKILVTDTVRIFSSIIQGLEQQTVTVDILVSNSFEN